ncbi:MAG: Phosphate regulon transcriptional regulatory protein PhoB (SphR) [Ktedonobacterales bacterium]|nr:MAG: Phosphate regulon transcriptional regulatory protein PhoB (SphR) [Ktedonobacterales bacterium]
METTEMDRTILVVEDDATLRDTIAYNLRGEGYGVLTANDGITALEIAWQNPVSLILLDLMLPRLDGLDVCRQLRNKPETAHIPILMLTARGEETDKVVGLELGADDYVTKPFSWKELRARIRALLRRGEQPAAADIPHAAPGATAEDRILIVNELRIDVGRRQVWRDDREIDLPARLFDLLVYMVRNRGIVLTRDRLLQHVWGYDFAGDTRTVDVHMRWLREKMENDPAHPEWLLTVRGVGYRFKG